MTRGDVARLFGREFDCSRATAYRMAATVIDLLLLDVLEYEEIGREHRAIDSARYGEQWRAQA